MAISTNNTFPSLQPKLAWLKERRRKVLEYTYNLAMHDEYIDWEFIEEIKELSHLIACEEEK